MEGDLFALVVRDDSMVDAGITQGDVAIIKAVAPERGEIVAIEESGVTVLRRYVVIAGIPHLLAENPCRPDLTVAYERPIQGTLWCLICTRPNGRGRLSAPMKKVSYLEERGVGLDSEFMAMLKSELKGGPANGSRRGAPARAKGSSKRRLKEAAPAEKKQVKYDQEEPRPPSGIGLNERGKTVYTTAPRRSICDEQPERPFGGAFVDALAQFALRKNAGTLRS